LSNKIGTVFSIPQMNLPNVLKYAFVLSKNNPNSTVRMGSFCAVQTIEGYLIGIVERIILENEYFSNVQTVKDYNEDNLNVIKGMFPSENFEYGIAITKCLGIISFKDKNNQEFLQIKRMLFPAKPGAEVISCDPEILTKFLGFNNENGIILGKVKNANFNASIDITNLLNKHFATLAISGAGKSYLTSVLLEELLLKEKENGIPSIILIDVHGEYVPYFKSIEKFKNRVNVQDSSYFQISVPKLTAYSFKKYQENISPAQIRELAKIILKIKEKNDNSKYTIKDIIDFIENDEDINKSTQQALIGWLDELDQLLLFGSQENPPIKGLIKTGELTIFNLQSETSIRKKQIIVDYIANQLFYLRKKKKIPPFLLIIEEAHQFCPEAAQSKAISKSIIETIAREGRKFMACLNLISQRPKRLSTTALSQCNSKLILKISNPYDLKHIMESDEFITKSYTEMISSLIVGELLIIGNAVNYPVFIEVRQRMKNSTKALSLSETCYQWWNIHENAKK
jgi:DNA helicase HerA-like ATPase